jgi:hypothetical protein
LNEETQGYTDYWQNVHRHNSVFHLAPPLQYDDVSLHASISEGRLFAIHSLASFLLTGHCYWHYRKQSILRRPRAIENKA